MLLLFFRYLRNPVQYTFEENVTRSDVAYKCYFIRTRQNIPRPSPGDLGIPIPQGMFKTPNPSPNTSRTATPVEHKSPPTSPLKTNSPEVDLPKFTVSYLDTSVLSYIKVGVE